MPDEPQVGDTKTEPEKTEPKAEPAKADLGDAGKKALDTERNARREAEKRVKELEPLAKKAQELEDAQKSELDKATEKVTAAEKRAAEAELAAARIEVAAEKGLTPAQARRLVGTTKEELEADADASIEDGTFVVGEAARRPNPDPNQGKETSAKEDPDAWLRGSLRK